MTARLPIEDIYGQVYRSDLWIKQTYERLIKFAEQNGIDKRKFTLDRYTNMVYYYYMELVNYPDDKLNIYSFLIWSINVKITIDKQRIAEILTDETKRINKKHAKPSMGEILIRPAKSVTGIDITNITIGKLSMSVPTNIYERLSNPPFTRDAFFRLLLRYQLIGRNKGLFWSIDIDLYKTFPSLNTGERSIPTLECFASPLNSTLTEYCSVYSEDVHYGSRGNFFSYIKTLSGPYRFIFNPPYTGRIMADGIADILSYMEKNPGCDFIAMLPYWRESEIMDRLSAEPNKHMLLLMPKEYPIHDFSLGEDLLVNVPIMFYVSIDNSAAKSKKYAKMIRNMLAIKAGKISKLLDPSTETIVDLHKQAIPEEQVGPLVYRNE